MIGQENFTHGNMIFFYSSTWNIFNTILFRQLRDIFFIFYILVYYYCFPPKMMLKKSPNHRNYFNFFLFSIKHSKIGIFIFQLMKVLWYIMEQEGNILMKFQPFWILNKELQEWEIQMKTNTSVADKCTITLNFPALDFPHSNCRNMVIPT